jgi:ferrochelatase
MIRELVQERTAGRSRDRLGTLPVWDVCPENCCPAPARR